MTYNVFLGHFRPKRSFLVNLQVKKFMDLGRSMKLGTIVRISYKNGKGTHVESHSPDHFWAILSQS